MSMTLQELADREEIRHLIHAYCRAVDRLDIALGHSIWHEDAVADYGPGQYQGPGKQAIDWICASHRQVASHSHQVAGVLIELSGNRAASESYVTGTLRVERDGTLQQLTVWARYVDRWERREGRWGLVARRVLLDHNEVREVTPFPSSITPGTRDESDASHAAFAWVSIG